MADNVIDALLGKEEDEKVEEVPAKTEPEKPEPEAEEPEQREGAKTVPLAALHEARARAKELNAELQGTRERMARMEALFERFQQDSTRASAPKETTYEEDPAMYLRQNMATMQQRLDAVEADGKQQRGASQQAGQVQVVLDRYAAAVRSFSQTHEDFNDAYTFLGKAVDADLQARGYTDPVERAKVMQYEEGFMVGRAISGGADPAELLYNYAKSRGYKVGGDENKIVRLQKGADAAKSLGGLKGGTAGEVTLQKLSELADGDPAEFDKEWAKAKRSGLLG